MRAAWLRILISFLMIGILALVAFGLSGCALPPKQMEPMLSYDELAAEIKVTHREFITLRTGQICEIKDTKIIACERRPGSGAETKQDIEAITREEGEK